MAQWIRHVENAIYNAELGISKLDRHVLHAKGMSGNFTRHFYNLVCSMHNVRYLEVGSWYGSTMCSALCGNSIDAVAIDNWSQFNGDKNIFIKNIKEHLGMSKVQLIERDCFIV